MDLHGAFCHGRGRAGGCRQAREIGGNQFHRVLRLGGRIGDDQRDRFT
jgi:hypothetical protein